MDEIKTKRLFLRKIHEGDIPFLIEGMNDLNISRFLAEVPSPYTA